VPSVLYTDPAWAVGADGEPSTAFADVEAEVFGAEVEIRLGPYENGRFITSGPAFLEALAGAEAVVIYRAEMSQEAIDALHPRCRVVARQGDGLDNLNARWLADAGIWSFNVPDYCIDEASTHAVAMMLAWERGLAQQDRRVKAGEWAIHADGVPRRLADCALGLVGFGRVGRAVAVKARPFFRTVHAHDPNVHADQMAAYGVAAQPFAELVAGGDVLSVHASLDATTVGLVGAAVLERVRPGTLLVNTARGKLVDSGAVLSALRAGRLAGFCADVFAPERPADDPVNAELASRADVLVSCHRGFLSAPAERSVRQRVADEVAWVLANDLPPRVSRQS
jgi:phosphoglycerate dehydrogenase-like enzyme